ncbi:hypothetical protein ASPZODRAFT_26686 [Penicilliopsis zonata CBS 506.65]|uniref:Uncharacterized protein n=1 Tax=Penicilliopsis zonata CBS 506.65 TaxID=1073090 RepID=A0A1L9SDP9_9EURO|nr:hypothetical protein ASPZODRAFT_26686 [Penicilliopsis zonata CBS 506.65]OJJ45326.1 hypothetical protein ASPZODRAFT_26686 [Penicilliopsis zonata CBS 506.65]
MHSVPAGRCSLCLQLPYSVPKGLGACEAEEEASPLPTTHQHSGHSAAGLGGPRGPRGPRGRGRPAEPGARRPEPARGPSDARPNGEARGDGTSLICCFWMPKTKTLPLPVVLLASPEWRMVCRPAGPDTASLFAAEVSDTTGRRRGPE